MTGIYKITNTVNEKCYIGQSIDIKKRWAKHKRESSTPSRKHYHYPLYQDMRKYGIENFEFEILEECEATKLNERESYYIEKYDSLNNGYNQTKGGGGILHYNELNDDIVLSIIQELKASSLQNFEISEKLDVSENIIKDINIGNLYRKSNEQYPLRGPSDYIKRDLDNTLYFCQRCGEAIVSPNANLCRKCVHETQQIVNRPEPLILAKMIKEVGFERTGKYFGVSGSSIKKWCKAYGIPYHKGKLIFWYNEQIGIANCKDKYCEPVDCKKAVQQINPFTNEIIATFESAYAAARALGKKKGTHITEACKGLLDLAYNFKWQYANEEERLKCNNKIDYRRPVYQLEPITNKIINSFESIRAAAVALGNLTGAPSAIRSVCRGQRNTAYGSKWCYVEDYIPPVPTSTSSTQTSNAIK